MLDIEKYSDGKNLFDGRYKLLRPLSTDGATADIWLARDVKTIDADLDSNEGGDKEESGMLVAIKIYRPKNALDIEGEQRFRDEYKIVYECRHSNLLQPTAFSIFEEMPYLVLPYCKYGSSEQLIGKKHTDDEIWKFILDVSSGLHRLHTNDPQIIHQDIKPANILIDNGKNFTITDFGISSKRNGVHGYYYGEWNSGTLAYMAPERFQENAELIPESDIWAFGATLFEILTGNVPFGEMGGKAQAEEGSKVPEIKGVSKDICKLIRACLSEAPSKRPTAQTLIEAAKTKSYPVKTKGLAYIVACATIAVILGAVLLFSVKPEDSQKAMFEKGMKYMEASSKDSLTEGLKIFEDLGENDYVPALYQIAYTYGWYSDSVSVQRKQVLGIEIYPRDDKRTCFLPKDRTFSDNAINSFNKIVQLQDPEYPIITAKSCYLLGCYYGKPNPFYKKDASLAKKYFKKAAKIALKANDTVFYKQVERQIKQL